jgi:hypothetical protein
MPTISLKDSKRSHESNIIRESIEIPDDGLFYFEKAERPLGYLQLHHIPADEIINALSTDSEHFHQGSNLWDYNEITKLTGPDAILVQLNNEDKGVRQRLLVDGKLSSRPMLFHEREFKVTSGWLGKKKLITFKDYPPIQDETCAEDFFRSLSKLSEKLQSDDFERYSNSKRKIALYYYNLLLMQLHNSNIQTFLNSNKEFLENIDTYLETGDSQASLKLIEVLQQTENDMKGRNLHFNLEAALVYAHFSRLEETHLTYSKANRTRNLRTQIGKAVLETVTAYMNAGYHSRREMPYSLSFNPLSPAKEEVIALLKSTELYIRTGTHDDAMSIVKHCDSLVVKTSQNGLFIALGFFIVGAILITGVPLGIWGLVAGGAIHLAIDVGMPAAVCAAFFIMMSVAVAHRENNKMQELANKTHENLSFFKQQFEKPPINNEVELIAKNAT